MFTKCSIKVYFTSSMFDVCPKFVTALWPLFKMNLNLWSGKWRHFGPDLIGAQLLIHQLQNNMITQYLGFMALGTVKNVLRLIIVQCSTIQDSMCAFPLLECNEMFLKYLQSTGIMWHINLLNFVRKCFLIQDLIKLSNVTSYERHYVINH